MKNARLSIKVSQEYRDNIEEKAKSEGMSISAFIRYSLDEVGPKSEKVRPKSDQPEQSPTFLIEQISIKDEQISIKDEQIKKLQSALDQSQTALDQSQHLQAMTEKRYETERKELIEMKDRSFWQKLTSVFE